jgi:hypothetical protein
MPWIPLLGAGAILLYAFFQETPSRLSTLKATFLSTTSEDEIHEFSKTVSKTEHDILSLDPDVIEHIIKIQRSAHRGGYPPGFERTDADRAAAESWKEGGGFFFPGQRSSDGE